MMDKQQERELLGIFAGLALVGLLGNEKNGFRDAPKSASKTAFDQAEAMVDEWKRRYEE